MSSLQQEKLNTKGNAPKSGKLTNFSRFLTYIVDGSKKHSGKIIAFFLLCFFILFILICLTLWQLEAEKRMTYLASAGGMILSFLAGKISSKQTDFNSSNDN